VDKNIETIVDRGIAQFRSLTILVAPQVCGAGPIPRLPLCDGVEWLSTGVNTRLMVPLVGSRYLFNFQTGVDMRH
jgi:hypothetical protein